MERVESGKTRTSNEDREIDDSFWTLSFDDDSESDLSEILKLGIPLWHYTSLKGLKGILECDDNTSAIKLWFTKCDCLNDSSEGIDVQNHYQKTLSKLLESKDISTDDYDFLRKVQISSSRSVVYRPHSTDDTESIHQVKAVYLDCDAYICCFSKKSDSLDMWRYYSKNDGGYGIEFDPYVLSDFLYPLNCNAAHKTFYNIFAKQVVYKDEEKDLILKKHIMSAYKIYCTKKTERGKQYMTDYLSSILSFLQYSFKHECFSTEEEVRLIYYRPKLSPPNFPYTIPNVHFREMNGVMIPYIEILFPALKQGISRIAVSPYIKSDFALETTKMYVNSRSVDCAVFKSQLPVRF